MNEVRFPPARIPDGRGGATRENAMRLLESVVPLIDSVRCCEQARKFDEPRSVDFYRGRMKIEAMDVYQALATILAGEVEDKDIESTYDFRVKYDWRDFRYGGPGSEE